MGMVVGHGRSCEPVTEALLSSDRWTRGSALALLLSNRSAERVTFAGTGAAYGEGVHQQETVGKSFPSARYPSGPIFADSP